MSILGWLNQLDIRCLTLPDSFVMEEQIFNAIPGVQRINGKIADYLEAIRALKTEKNTYPRINHLPPELLARIFVFCKPEKETWDGRAVKRLIALSHVCAHWRSISLRTPELWSSILLTKVKWGEEMLVRSKGALLTVDVESLHEQQPSFALFQNVLGSMSRIAVLRLNLRLPILSRVVEHLRLPAPFLDTLAVSASSDYSSAYSPTSHFNLPSPIFDGKTPRLRHLQLRRCAGLDWSSSLLTGLSSLDLTDVPPGNRPTMPDLLAMLQRMPDLDRLTLKDCIPISSVHPRDCSLVNLQRLSQISLDGAASAVSFLFQQLTFPSAAKIRISGAISSAAQIQEGLDLLTSLQTCCLSDVGTRFPALMVDESMRQRIQLRWWATSTIPDPTTDMYDIHTERDSACPLWLSLVWATWDSPLDAMLHILRALSLADVSTLIISCSEPLPKAIWAKTLTPATSIESLTIVGSSAIGLIEALGAKMPDDRSAGAVVEPTGGERAVKPSRGKRRRGKGKATSRGGPPILPKLDKLVLREVVFGPHDQDGEALCEILIGKLRQRARAGAKLRSLEITEARGLTEDDVAELEEVVPDVDWDGGAEDSYDDEEDETNIWSMDSDENEYYDDYGSHYGMGMEDEDEDLYGFY